MAILVWYIPDDEDLPGDAGGGTFDIQIETLVQNGDGKWGAGHSMVLIDKFPHMADQETKDRLWEAVKTALGIFKGIPGNLCTTCQERFAWAGTTTCVRCSLGGREITDADRVNWEDRVIPRPREII